MSSQPQLLNLHQQRTARQVSIEFGNATSSVSGNFLTSTPQSGVGIQENKIIREVSKHFYDFKDKGALLYLKDIGDPRTTTGFWIYIIFCVIGISVNPLFFYIYIINAEKMCLEVNIVWRRRVLLPLLALIMYALIFIRRHFLNSAARILLFYPISGVLVITFGTPVMEEWKFLLLLSYFLLEYLLRIITISSSFTKATWTSDILAKAKWVKAVFNLLLYMHGGHVIGALWYYLATEREVACWKHACSSHNGCNRPSFPLYCTNNTTTLGDRQFLNVSCPLMKQDNTSFELGIYADALQSGIVGETSFPRKLLYSLRWGLQNLSGFGQNLEPSSFPSENIFVITITISGVLMFVFFIGNLQTYLQSETVRSEAMRLKGRETKQCMSFQKLPKKLRKEVRKHQPHKWQESKSVDIVMLLNNLPEDIGKNIKHELCLEQMRKVEELGKLSKSSLEDLCERLKPVSFIERTHIVREGDPIYEMLFVVQGKLRIYTSNSTPTGSPNHLEDGDCCGEEIVTWFQADPYSSNLPNSTRTIQALTNVEAFVLLADDLQNYFVKRYEAVRFIQSFWRFRRILRSKRNGQTSTLGVNMYSTNSV